MTKADLQEELAIIKHNKAKLETDYELRKQEIQLVLGLYAFSNSYGTEKRIINEKSWAELFAEIGRLKTLANQTEENIELKKLKQEVDEQRSIIYELRLKLSNN